MVQDLHFGLQMLHFSQFYVEPHCIVIYETISLILRAVVLLFVVLGLFVLFKYFTKSNSTGRIAHGHSREPQIIRQQPDVEPHCIVIYETISLILRAVVLLFVVLGCARVLSKWFHI
jgi:hypothetical protein